MNAPRSGCPINLTLEALGDRWSLIVIRDLMFGNRRHFRELLTRLEERRNRTSIAQTSARFTGARYSRKYSLRGAPSKPTTSQAAPL